MRILAALLALLLWAVPSAAQVVWHPGVAANVPLAAYIGAPGTNCASGYAYASKVGRVPDYWVYYAPQEGSTTANWQTTLTANLPTFKNAGCNQNIFVKVPMIANDAATVYMTYKSVGLGNYDASYWTYLATALSNAGYTHPIVVIGWEQNNNSYAWSDNYIVMDGGTGTGLMLPLVFNHSTGAITSVDTTSFNQYTKGHGYSANDVVTVEDGTCATPGKINILTVNGGGVPQTFSINTAGACTTVPGPGNWIYAFQDISAAIKAVLPNAIIAFDPNCFTGLNGWDADYPGDAFVQMVGIDCYDQSNIVNIVAGGGAALANGAVTVANQPQTSSILHIAITNGATPITGGTIAITYIAGGSHTDTFNLATGANGQSNFFTSLATGTVSGITVANLAGGSGASNVVVVADAPNARWYYTQHEPDGLTTMAALAATTVNAKCGQSPSNCLSTINVTTGASKLLGILETGTYTAGTATLNSGANTGVDGNDDPYWIDQEAQWCATNKCSVLLQFDAKPALMFGNATGYAQPGNAAAFIQDYAP